MNKQETAQVITLLAGNYNTIADKSREQKSMMLETWYECLNDLDYKVVLAAIKKCIIESPYPPTIHDIRVNAVTLTNDTPERTPIEAWQEAFKMISCGTYMTQEQFDSHSDDVKRFFGSVEHLRSYSTNEDFNIDVVRSNFLSQYSKIKQSVLERKLMPPKLLALQKNSGLLGD